jgi:hypothetical protein
MGVLPQVTRGVFPAPLGQRDERRMHGDLQKACKSRRIVGWLSSRIPRNDLTRARGSFRRSDPSPEMPLPAQAIQGEAVGSKGRAVAEAGTAEREYGLDPGYVP